MKTLKYSACIILGMCLYLACDVNPAAEGLQEGTQIPEVPALESKVNDAVKQPERPGITVPFKASFFTANPGVGIVPDDRCTDPALLETQTGEGEATYLGRFTVKITFCIDLTDVFNEEGQVDGVLEEGESLPYVDGIGTFIAANGDELHFTIAGAVLPSEDPAFDFQFSDPFVFTGGTGRFEGARGNGLTDSFVVFGTGTTHEWTGNLIL